MFTSKHCFQMTKLTKQVKDFLLRAPQNEQVLLFLATCCMAKNALPTFEENIDFVDNLHKVTRAHSLLTKLDEA